jgi:hypothetical protein
MSEPEVLSSQADATTSEVPRRTRHFRKRRLQTVPRMPLPVKALWDQASEAEKMQAHRTAAVLLQMWLGKVSRVEAARELGISPLRLWQQSQQAIAGMVAGNLRQPRYQRRKGVPAMAVDPAEDPQRLRQRIKELERQLRIAEDVNRLLREFPVHRGVTKAGTSTAANGEPTMATASGEESGGVPRRKKQRLGTRRSTVPGSPAASPELADGAGPHPAP